MNTFQKFMLGLILLMTVLVLGTLYANGPSGFSLQLPLSYLITIFIVLFFTTTFSGYLTLRSHEKRAQVVVRSVMSSTVIKFFVYLGILLAFAALAYESIRPIATIIFGFYICTTIYEKVYLYGSMNKPDSSSETEEKV